VYMLCWCGYKHHVTSNTVGFVRVAWTVVLFCCCRVVGCTGVGNGTGCKAILEVFNCGD